MKIKQSKNGKVRPTVAMKLRAIADVRGWSSEFAHKGRGAHDYSDLVKERAEDWDEVEQWRRAYDWVDTLLLKAFHSLNQATAQARPRGEKREN
jgi:hypothetical protein